MTTRRLSVLDTAEHLGVSVNAVRMRIRRGTLASEKDEDGTVWVLVSDYSPDDSQTTRQTSGQVEDLREQVAYLKQIISTRDEEIRRRDHIIAAMAQRIPELEAAPQQEASQPSEETPSAPTDSEPVVGSGEAPRSLTARLRRWWRG